MSGMALNEGVTSGSTVTLNVVTAAHWPASGVKVYVVVPGVEVLMVDDHEPLTPFVEVVGNTGAVSFWQILSMASKVGVIRSVTVTVRVVVVAHWPAAGVNV